MIIRLNLLILTSNEQYFGNIHGENIV